MAQKVIQGNADLAKQIKNRRNELGLTIEEAAQRAGVGTKTWSRYEAGESIRTDKGKGICKALKWHCLPEEDNEDDDTWNIEYFRNHRAWSTYLEKNFGVGAAVAFAVGSEVLMDHINEDIRELSSRPAGTHIGQLEISWLCDDLPEQFLMYYDYEFLYRLKSTLNTMINRANNHCNMLAHSVLEELVIYLCNEEAVAMIELCGRIDGTEESEVTDPRDWVFDLFDDSDIIMFLYSGMYLEPNDAYHIKNWGI
ncbi:MAG: helix-turn-helix transcriptional regulator [Ruminococcaceae bacterium]|nr:helix-turn-helix transcriptional regulator [Oscillospiraceae bacterium]